MDATSHCGDVHTASGKQEVTGNSAFLTWKLWFTSRISTINTHVSNISMWWDQATRWRCSYITLSIYNQTAAIMSKDTRTSHTTISQQRNDIIIGENFSSENQYQQYLKYLQQWTNPGCYLLLTWDSCSFGVRTNCAGMFKILHVVLTRDGVDICQWLNMIANLTISQFLSCHCRDNINLFPKIMLCWIKCIFCTSATSSSIKLETRKDSIFVSKYKVILEPIT